MNSERREFNRLVALLDYPMFIVTTAADDVRAGCLVGFATQASIHPPRFLVCLSVKNLTYRVAADGQILVVHLVPERAGRLAELFGGETGDDTDKFARCSWTPGPGGAPVLTELENWFAGRIIGRSDFGDHCGFLLEPVEEQAASSEEPLTFHQTQEIEPGHEP
jgi:flavin reductase (DIM6/NTAB) family NADH-FMN oxidoreductase RutF